MLFGKKILITGVANEWSLAWAIARKLHDLRAELAFSIQGPRLERRVRPLAESVNAKIVQICDATKESEIGSLFSTLATKWGSLDAVIHSIAFADVAELEGRFIHVSRQGFQTALDVSAYSLVALARQAEPLLKNGGAILTLTNSGSERVVPGYHLMGVAKAALEAAVRYLAVDLGPQKIRVNAISAGPIKTLAAMGIGGFREMQKFAEQKSLLGENATAEDVGALAAFLCSEGAKHITGSVLYIDSGLHVVGA